MSHGEGPPEVPLVQDTVVHIREPTPTVAGLGRAQDDVMTRHVTSAPRARLVGGDAPGVRGG